MTNTKINLDKACIDFLYDQMHYGMANMTRYPTKRDILKAAIPILKEIYQKDDDSYIADVKEFIEYLDSLIYEKDK